MSKRNLTWLRQNTNVEDLLDDGIENNSDLKSFSRAADLNSDMAVPAEGTAGKSADPSSEGTSSTNPAPEDPLEASQSRFSFFGVEIGVLIAAGGAFLVLFPVDMFVFHDRTKYYRPFWEHVTHGRSEFYGVVGLLLGIAVIGFAVYKPRQ